MYHARYSKYTEINETSFVLKRIADANSGRKKGEVFIKKSWMAYSPQGEITKSRKITKVEASASEENKEKEFLNS